MSVLCFAALRIISQQSIKYFADIDLDGDTNLHHPYKKVLTKKSLILYDLKIYTKTYC